MRKVRVLLASEHPLRHLAERADKRMEELRQTMRKPQSGKHIRNDAKFYFEG
ncbi:MAG: hypothetical protein WC381_11275 [Kiritimatiellia bacterium]|jgi:hypothetical protein